MLNLVSKLDKEFEIGPHGGMFSPPIIREASGKFPSLSVTIKKLIAATVILLPVKRPNFALEKDSVKKRSPRNTH
jgi:hypothetical protein